MVDERQLRHPATGDPVGRKADPDTGPPGVPAVSTFTSIRVPASSGVKIKHEKSWILAIQVAPGDVSMWYVSVPDGELLLADHGLVDQHHQRH